MSDNLQNKITLALDELRQNVEAHREVLDKAQAGYVPSLMEQSALAFMLQSCYTWFENVLKCIVSEYDGVLPDTRSWHSDLLKSVRQATDNRPTVISEPLYTNLKEFLGFRHFARHASCLMLDWNEMNHLVLSCDDVLKQFETEIQVFMEQVNHGS